MWTKVKKASNYKPRAARTTFAVARSKTGHRAACLIVPGHAVTGERADVYSDGNGKLAFSMGAKGEFRVTRTGPSTVSRKISIPMQFAHLIPFGQTEATVAMEGGMLVLDTAQFRTIALAAE